MVYYLSRLCRVLSLLVFCTYEDKQVCFTSKEKRRVKKTGAVPNTKKNEMKARKRFTKTKRSNRPRGHEVLNCRLRDMRSSAGAYCGVTCASEHCDLLLHMSPPLKKRVDHTRTPKKIFVHSWYSPIIGVFCFGRWLCAYGRRSIELGTDSAGTVELAFPHSCACGKMWLERRSSYSRVLENRISSISSHY